jgi:drug/metabolite transporter (DMT)-like permease
VRQPHAVPVPAYWLVVLIALLWGLSWPCMKLSLSEMEPLRYRAFAQGVSAAGLFLLAWLTRARIAVPPGAWGRLLFITTFNMLLWGLLMIYGLKYVEAGRAVILAYTFPVWTVPLNVWLMRERLTARRLSGLVLGIAGMALLLGDELFALGRSPLGALLLIASAMSWALGTVAMKRWPVEMPAVTHAAWQTALGWLPMFLLGLALESGPLHPFGLPVAPLLAVLYGALVASIVCQWAWFRLVAITSASVSSLSMLAVPIAGVFLSMLVLGERPQPTDFAALALVVASLAIVLIPPRSLPAPA